MVPLLSPRARVDGKTRRRKTILPRPLARRVQRLPSQGEGKMHTAKSVFEIVLVLRFNSHQMTPQRFTQIQRKHRHAIFAAFGVAHRNLGELKIEIFYPTSGGSALSR